MSKIKLIISADDYGVIKEIDDAIIDGIKIGIINTVSVVVNFRRCKSSLKRLIAELESNNLLSKVGIGLHLNITMGKPVSNYKTVKSLVNSKKNFYTHKTYQSFPNLERFDMSQVRREANGQMQRFVNYLAEIANEVGVDRIPVDHISSHFNLFNAIPKLSNILVEICEHYKKFGAKKTLPIPVRRPIPIMVEYEKTLKQKVKEIASETKFYIITKNFSVGALFYKSKWLKKDKLKKLIKDNYKANGIRCPHAMFICFYATRHQFEEKVDQLLKMLRDLRQVAVNENSISDSEPLYLEIIHHLGYPVSDVRRDSIKISGFDKRYMRKFRPKEISILNTSKYLDMLRVGGISHGKFSDMKKIQN